jgi:hypothetical protein
MARVTAEIVGPWLEVHDGEDVTRIPRVSDEYSLYAWEDITFQEASQIPPSPNLVSIRADCDDSVVAGIRANPLYRVMWANLSEEPFVVPTTTQYRAIRDWFEAQGYTREQWLAAAGSTVQGRTIAVITQALRAHMRGLRRA